MIPQEKSAAVTRGLLEAFGVTAFEDIRRMTKGNATSLVFRIVVRGASFLLKMIMRTDDATRHFACMRAAAEAGLAPRVWYTNTEDRIAITDFVETVAFPEADALIRIPSALRALHALPPFAGVPNHINTSCMFLINKGPALDGFIRQFQAANVLTPGESEELFARYEQVAAVYPYHDPDMVSSHNDLFKPDNILFDGRRLWLVDWEAAFLNDRYADLAVAANLLVTNDAEEEIYLQEYFGRPPDSYELARYFLMQQVAHMFYAMAFLLLGVPDDGPATVGDNIPEFKDFRQRMWEGEVDLRDKPMKTVYGRVHWNQLLQNVRQARFDEALKIVANRQSGA